MNTSRIRAIIAVTVVGVFMFITAFMAIFPLVAKQQVVLSEYADFFVKTASVYTGIIGVIIGFYFGRALPGEKIDRRDKEVPPES